jgi:type I pantothenate kinase
LASVNELVEILLSRRATGVLVVGLTGGVASGKSTLALELAEIMRASAGNPRVDGVGTDGFLHSNAVLVERGLLGRKGIPDTYDREALHAALQAVRRRPTPFPGYSHLTYDVDPALTRVIDPPDVLIVEGLGLDPGAPIDVLIYLDAAEGDQEAWFVNRFMEFWEQGRRDETSFYARFRDMEPDAAQRLAGTVWTTINRPNLRDHIAPLREAADIVVLKGSDHTIRSIRLHGAADTPAAGR